MALIDLRNLSNMGEKGVVNTLVRSLSLRLHVSLIIAFSWACGFLVTRQLHNFGVDTLAVRYSLALIAAYAAFLAGVRVWLWLVVGAEPARNNVADSRGNSNWELPAFGGNGSGNGVAAPSGGGGGSGGAGSSGDWDGPAPSANLQGIGTQLGLGSSSGSSSGGGGGGGGGDGGDVGEGIVALLVLVFFILVVVTYFAAIFYVVYVGPHLLGEAAFQFMLAGGLVKHARKTDASWMENVIKATWIPFAVVFIITVAFGYFAGSAYPDAHTMREVLRASGWWT